MFRLSIMTCEGREEALAQTLQSLTATDWNEAPTVQIDPFKIRNRMESQTRTAKLILDDSLGFEWEYLVFCEDDINFNMHLRHNLMNWLPIREGWLSCGTLYLSPPCREVGANFGLAPAHMIGGSQAVVMSREFVGYVLSLWDKLDGMQDLRFYGALAKRHSSVFVHLPNLVQHQQMSSTWGGMAHTSSTYDPDWKA